MTTKEREKVIKLYNISTENIMNNKISYDREINTCMGLLNTREWDIEYVFECQQTTMILEMELIKRKHC